MVFSEINKNPNMLSYAEFENKSTELRSSAESRKAELKNIIDFAEEYSAQKNVEQNS